MSRQLRRGFAEKLESKGIHNVFRQDADNPLKFDLVWKQIDGVWTPMNDDTYYDEKDPT